MAFPQFSPDRILVLHLGQLAEVFFSLPALHALRQRFHRAHISLATTSIACQLVAMTPAVNEVLPVDTPHPSELIRPLKLYRWGRFLQTVRPGEYDLTVNLPSYSRSNILTWLTRARVRQAARRPGHALGFLLGFWPLEGNPKRHLVDMYFDILRPLGIHGEHDQFRLQPSPEVGAKIDKRLGGQQFRQGRLWMGIYPSADDPAQRWPSARFVELGNRLVHNLQVQLLLLGGLKKSRLARDLSQHFTERPLVLDDLTIPELAAVLSTCTALITDDAGAATLAAGVETPVLGLGFPSYMAPIGSEHVIIQRGYTDYISVNEVLAAASQVIARERTTTLIER